MKKKYGVLFVCASVLLANSAYMLPVSSSAEETSPEERTSLLTTEDSTAANQETTASVQESVLADSATLPEEEPKDLGDAAAQDDQGYTFPDPSERSNLGIKAFSRSLFQLPDDVSPDNTNLPASSFIDVSSHNGSISVDQYRMMKGYGVQGVVVKLTEGTSYFNPFAKEQIANAQAAGLTVSAYHFSRFATTAQAEAEAVYFASKAIECGLPANTVMVNDAESAEVVANNPNGNSYTFRNKVMESGYLSTAIYTSRSWIDNGYINPNTFGYDRVWVAQYPYHPTAAMKWNSEFAAWQWSSRMYFPGIDHPFDISAAYNTLFTQAAGNENNNNNNNGDGGNSSGNLDKYHTIVSETDVNKDAQISISAYAEYGINPWGTADYKSYGSLAPYSDRKVRLLKEIKTSAGNTYYKFQLDDGHYWSDYRNFKDFDKVVAEKDINQTLRLVPTIYNEYGSAPYGTADYTRLGSLAAYTNQQVTVLKEATTTANNRLFQFRLNGQTYWADYRNFGNFDTIKNEKTVDHTAKIIPTVYNEYGNAPYGTAEYAVVGSLTPKVGTNVAILKEVVTSADNRLYQFSLNGVTYWADYRNFQLNDVVTARTELNRKVTIKATAYNEYGTAPYNTAGYICLGSLASKVGQTVKVIEEVKTSGNNRLIKFEMPGTSGQQYWADYRNFTL